MADELVVAADEMQTHLRGLEAELEEYPDQRGEILLEIAGARLDMGDASYVRRWMAARGRTARRTWRAGRIAGLVHDGDRTIHARRDGHAQRGRRLGVATRHVGAEPPFPSAEEAIETMRAHRGVPTEVWTVPGGKTWELSPERL